MEKWSGEPSTITLNDSVGNPALPSIFSGSYYPSYLQLFASEKGCYIKWIADGLSDESPEKRNLGYIFLYFYGIISIVWWSKERQQSISSYRCSIDLIDRYRFR